MNRSTIPHEVMARGVERPRAPAYCVRDAGGWTPTTWSAHAADVRRAARALMALGLEPGGRVALLGYNRPEWVTFDLAAMGAGGVPAGIYATSSAAECAYILDHSGASAVLVEDSDQLAKILPQRERLRSLRHIVTMRGAEPVDDAQVIGWEAFLARADEVPEAALDERLNALKPDDLATLIYTSGTTGPPKGVMLSHDNLVWTSREAVALLGLTPHECGLSYLPLSHIAEQMLSIHIPTLLGSTIYFAEALERLRENLSEVRPTYFFGVPRVWEKFHVGIEVKLAEARGIRAKLLAWARRAGRGSVAALNAGTRRSVGLRLRHALAERLVLRKVKAAIGLDRARICASGAAPISPEVLSFFGDFGLSVIEVYGQSEGTGVTTVNRAGRTRYGSVGPTYPGVQVRIADDDEVLLRGPNVFLGYLGDPEATRETLVDGWLHSGDLGRVDEDGFHWITGRKKDILITAGGKNISPGQIERRLTDHGLIANAVVVGDGRRYLTALISLDEEDAEVLASRHGEPGPAREATAVQEAVQRIIEEANQHLARVAQVKRFTILPRPLSLANGELTPTLKVKREVVAERYAGAIDAMYAEEAASGAA